MNLKQQLGWLASRIILSMSLLIILGAPGWGQWSEPIEDDKPHFEITPYLVGPGMGGDLTVRGRTASFSRSPGDILGNLQFGFMGRTRFSYKKWFVGLDGVYLGLGTSSDLADSDMDQVIVEPSVGYRLAPALEVFGGARYMNLTAETTFRGPGESSLSGTQSWWDPFFGGRLVLPIKGRLSASARIDIGGFGAGSRIAVNSEPMINIKFWQHGALHLGWKFYYADYRNDADEFRYDMLTTGPLFGATFRW